VEFGEYVAMIDSLIGLVVVFCVEHDKLYLALELLGTCSADQDWADYSAAYL
jgi:hypothetical protein